MGLWEAGRALVRICNGAEPPLILLELFRLHHRLTDYSKTRPVHKHMVHGLINNFAVYYNKMHIFRHCQSLLVREDLSNEKCDASKFAGGSRLCNKQQRTLITVHDRPAKLRLQAPSGAAAPVS